MRIFSIGSWNFLRFTESDFSAANSLNVRRLNQFAGTLAGSLGFVTTTVILSFGRSYLELTWPKESNLLLVALLGAGVGTLLQLLLAWAHSNNTNSDSNNAVIRGSVLPWFSVLFLFSAFVAPPPIQKMIASPGGPLKYALTLSLVFGTICYAFSFLKPLLAEFNPRRLTLGITVIGLLLSIASGVRPPNESDEGDYIAAALALSHYGEPRVDKAVKSGLMSDFYQGDYPSSWIPYSRQTFNNKTPYQYSLRAPGYPLLLAPFTRASLHIENEHLRWYFVYLPALFLFALLSYICVKYFQPFEKVRVKALSLSIFSVPILYYITNTQPEIFMALCTALCIYLISLKKPKGDSEWLLAILSPGMLIVHERLLPLSLVFFAFGLHKSSKRVRYILYASLAAALVFVTDVNFARTSFRFVHIDSSTNGMSNQWNFMNWIGIIFSWFTSARTGLFPIAPALLICVFGLSKISRTETKAGLIGVLVYFLTFLVIGAKSTTVPHARYFIPILPCLWPLAAQGCAYLSERQWGEKMFRGLFGIQLINCWVFLAIPAAWRLL